LKDYFTLSKKERNAVFILLAILAATIIVPYFIPEKKMRITIDEDLQQQLDKYLVQNPRETRVINSTSDSVPETVKSYALFQFDPNTLSEGGFRKLGMSDKVIHTIVNYRNKGGRFKTPEDIRKIYGLPATEATRLMPYIQIDSSKNNQTNYTEEKSSDQHIEQHQSSSQKININTATAEEWKSLPGIGEVLSNRIVKFRNMLGGFKSVDEVHKTYGLSDSTFQAIKPYLVFKDSTR
jgi:competence ComEA-like helix-hairpin-helix protein